MGITRLRRRFAFQKPSRQGKEKEVIRIRELRRSAGLHGKENRQNDRRPDMAPENARKSHEK
jgi:hypothetical protein